MEKGAPGTHIEQLERRVKADPTSIAFAALAEEYRRAGRHQEAIEVCRAGLSRHPAYLSARVTLGRALIEVGQLEEAKAELEHVLQTAPENLAAVRGLAEIHHRRGDISQAAEHYKSAMEIAEHHAVVRGSAEPPDEQADNGLSLDHLHDVLKTTMPASAAAPAPPPSPDQAALAELERLLDAILARKGQRDKENGRA
jgi:Tfp pilus assembly protein PilF